MDSHDIFKKITRGVHFRRKIKSHNGPEKQVEPTGGVKTELLEQFNDLKYIGDENAAENNEQSSSIEKENDTAGFSFIKDNVSNALASQKKRKKDGNSGAKKRLLEQEKISCLRNTYKISAIGKRIPPPIKTFDKLESEYQVPAKLIEKLAVCGYSLPTPIQMQAIPIMLQGRSLMGCAPTGSGKTVAFLLPIIRDLQGQQRKGFRALILAPTRELAQQIHRECLRLTEKTELKTHIINKVSQAEQKFGEKSSKKYDILVSTPNRICYLLSQERPLLNFSQVEWFVVDEADKLLEDGVKSFKEQFDQILAACTSPSRKVALFSATYTVPVAKWAIRHLKGLIRVTVGERNSATDAIQQDLLFVGSESGKLLAFRDLVRSGLQPPVLVFVQSKDRAKQLFSELIYDGLNVDVIHADRSQKQRDNVVKAFREGKIWVLICTELMSRGIDFKGVNLVVNYDFPPTSISYIHRIGRTGRAGRPGRAITYFTQDDTTNLRSIAHIIKNSGGTVPDFMLTLRKVKNSERKRLSKQAPERDDILTVPKFQMRQNEKVKRMEKLKGRVLKSAFASDSVPQRKAQHIEKIRKKRISQKKVDQ